MTNHSLFRASSPGRPPRASGVVLSTAEYDDHLRELAALCDEHKAQFARDLRDARAGGSPGDGDEWLTALENAAVDQGRIAQLERLLASATVVDESLLATDNRGRLGALVRVQDQRGKTIEYELVGTRRTDAKANHVSVGSPVGAALLGTGPGDVVSVPLPGGRERVLRVLEVTPARAVTSAGVGGAQPAPLRAM
jgi:transcription elongation factor GreA